LCDLLRRVPLTAKMMGMVLGMALLVGGGLSWHFRSSWRRDEVGELEVLGRLRAEHVAARVAPLVRTGAHAELRALIEEVADLSPEISRLEVRDASGALLASAQSEEAPEAAAEVLVPVGDGGPGSLRLALNGALVNAEVRWLMRQVFITFGTVTAAGMAGAWGLARALTRPIHGLVEGARAVAKGDYQVRVPVHGLCELSELAAAYNEMAVALQQNEGVRRQLRRKVIAAAEEERKRVARELHDHTGQALTSLIAGLSALEGGASPTLAGELRAQAAQTLDEVHDLTLALRPSALDDLGLVPALQKLCVGVARRFALQAGCSAVGLADSSRLAGEVEVALYRIVQEALTNAARHGRARSVEVLLQRKPASVLAVIEDDGCGFEARDWRARCLRSDRLGLLGIEERAALVGGTLRVESQPGSGTSLFVEIPLPENDHDR
jgi:signal transduction histidine kinase